MKTSDCWMVCGFMAALRGGERDCDDSFVAWLLLFRTLKGPDQLVSAVRHGTSDSAFMAAWKMHVFQREILEPLGVHIYDFMWVHIYDDVLR